jgi:hypothetical protein
MAQTENIAFHCHPEDEHDLSIRSMSMRKEKGAALALAVMAVMTVMAGCTTSSYLTESALAFPEKVPVKNLVVGTFTYDTAYEYLVYQESSLVKGKRSFENEHEVLSPRTGA